MDRPVVNLLNLAMLDALWTEWIKDNIRPTELQPSIKSIVNGLYNLCFITGCWGINPRSLELSSKSLSAVMQLHSQVIGLESRIASLANTLQDSLTSGPVSTPGNSPSQNPEAGSVNPMASPESAP